MRIIKKKWDDDLIGYCCETDDGKYFQVQFDLETNRLHADYNTFTAVLDVDNNYDLNLTDDEKEQIKQLIKYDNEFREMTGRTWGKE